MFYPKKIFLCLITFLFFSTVSIVNAQSPEYDSFTGETTFDFFTGLVPDSGERADLHILKIVKKNGDVEYKLKLFEFFSDYRGDLIGENGKVKVFNTEKDDYEFYDLLIEESVNNGNGGYSFIYKLPSEAIELARVGKKFSTGYEEHVLDLRCYAHNHYGEKLKYDGRTYLSSAFEEGL